MPKSCEQIAEMLVDYADGQLSPAESNEVSEHLAKCADCRRTVDALQRSLELAEVIWEDGLAETEAIRIPISQESRKLRWPWYAAIAASILLVAATSVVWRVLVRPTEAGPTFAEIERKVIESGNAARLLAAAELLSQYPETETVAKRQYRRIVERYPETPAAARAKLRIQ